MIAVVIDALNICREVFFRVSRPESFACRPTTMNANAHQLLVENE
jgi:hypothetical protein